MGRPNKYATAEEAAQHNLYSKLAGHSLGLSVEEFMHLVTGKCDLCGQPPQEILIVDRKDGRHELAWHYLMIDGEDKLKPLCRMCRMLLSNYDLKELLSHCARIMARRKWGVTNRWFFHSQEKPQVKRSWIDPTTGMSE